VIEQHIPAVAGFVYLYVTLISAPLSYYIGKHALRRFRHGGREDWSAWALVLFLALVFIIAFTATWFAALRLTDSLELAQQIPIQIVSRTLAGVVLSLCLLLYLRPRTVIMYAGFSLLVSLVAVVMSQH